MEKGEGCAYLLLGGRDACSVAAERDAGWVGSLSVATTEPSAASGLLGIGSLIKY